tara:strand:+ start:376 stop:498 length:123 start_codon:yes stop_codon:yes gene_type:complete
LALIIKQLDKDVEKTPNTRKYPNELHPQDKKVYCLKNQIK